MSTAQRELSISERLANWFGIKNKRAEELETQLAEKEGVIEAQEATITDKGGQITKLKLKEATLQKQVDAYEKEIRAISAAIEDDRKKESGKSTKAKHSKQKSGG